MLLVVAVFLYLHNFRKCNKMSVVKAECIACLTETSGLLDAVGGGVIRYRIIFYH